MTQYISILEDDIIAFRKHCEAGNHWDSKTAESIQYFDRYCYRKWPERICLTQEMVDDWCAKRNTEKNNSCRSRIYPVYNFINFMRSRNRTQVNPPEMPKQGKRTYIPHAFTPDELLRFFNCCDHVEQSLITAESENRKYTVPVLFRLLYSSGIRTCEARLFAKEDVNFENGILNIQQTKKNIQHYVVLHDTTCDLLKKYDDVISKLYPDRKYFFPGYKHDYLSSGWLNSQFRTLWAKANPGVTARPYDFRHNYAIMNINSWIGDGFDAFDKLVYLSKSMGHTSLDSTKYYYSLVPELANIIEEKTADEFDSIVPEVEDEDDE